MNWLCKRATRLAVGSVYTLPDYDSTNHGISPVCTTGYEIGTDPAYTGLPSAAVTASKVIQRIDKNEVS
jgi:hypothetical protein